MATWKIDGNPRTFRTLTQAMRAAARTHKRALRWGMLTHGPDGRMLIRGTTGVETDDKVTIRRSN